MPNIANLLSGFRLVIVPVLLCLAWVDARNTFLIFFACSLLSDFVDGFIARRLHQASEFGANLDSWADFATYMTVPFCAWWLWPDVIAREAVFVMAVIVSYVIPVAIGLLKYGRLTCYHTWGAKLAAVLIGASTFVLLTEGASWPFHIATAVLVVAEIEEIAITATLPDWRPNVASLWHATKLRQGPH